MRRETAAFTLVEVAVAAAIMLLALSVFIPSFVMAHRSAVAATRRMEAVHRARGVMEDLITLRYYDPQLEVGRYTTPLSTVRYSVVQENLAQYTVKTIAVTSTWVTPVRGQTAVVVLVSSVSPELHQ